MNENILNMLKNIREAVNDGDAGYVGFVASVTWREFIEWIDNLTAERDRLAAELAELKKKIDESPELKIFQAADMWSIKLDELSMLFGFGMYKDMKPGETRRFKLVEWKEGAE